MAKKKPARNRAPEVETLTEVARKATKGTPPPGPAIEIDQRTLDAASESSGYGLLPRYQIEQEGKGFNIQFETAPPLDSLPGILQAKLASIAGATGEVLADCLAAAGATEETIRRRDALLKTGADPQAVYLLVQWAIDLGRIIERIELRPFEPLISAAKRQRAGAKKGAAKTNAKKTASPNYNFRRERAQSEVARLMKKHRVSYTEATRILALDWDVSDRTIRTWTTKPASK